MKQLLTLALLLCLCLNSYSQFSIGDHAGTIVSENSTRKTEWSKIADNDVFIVHFKDADINFVIGDNMICFAAIITPFSPVADNATAELLNEKWTILSSTKWRMYNGRMILKAEREVTKDNKPYYFISIDN